MLRLILICKHNNSQGRPKRRRVKELARTSNDYDSNCGTDTLTVLFYTWFSFTHLYNFHVIIGSQFVQATVAFASKRISYVQIQIWLWESDSELCEMVRKWNFCVNLDHPAVHFSNFKIWLEICLTVSWMLLFSSIGIRSYILEKLMIFPFPITSMT